MYVFLSSRRSELPPSDVKKNLLVTIWSMRALNVSGISVDILSRYLKFIEIQKERRRLRQKQRLLRLLEEVLLREEVLRVIKRKSDQLNRLLENLRRWMKLQRLEMLLVLELGLNRARSLLLRRWLGEELSKQMLTVSVDVLVRNVMDDFTGDVDERDVVRLSDVKDGVAGAVGK